MLTLFGAFISSYIILSVDDLCQCISDILQDL